MPARITSRCLGRATKPRVTYCLSPVKTAPIPPRGEAESRYESFASTRWSIVIEAGNSATVSAHAFNALSPWVISNIWCCMITGEMGMSWAQYGIPDLIYRDVVIDPANPQHIFAASNAGVFASTDGGGTWGSMSEGIPAGMVISALSFNAASRQLAASTYGRGVYMLDVSQPARPRHTLRPTPRPSS